MSDDKKRKKNSDEPRSGGVWLMLAVLVVAVAVSGYLMSGTSQRLRYPDLVRLLEQTRYEQYGSNRLVAAGDGSPSAASPADPADGVAQDDTVIQDTAAEAEAGDEAGDGAGTDPQLAADDQGVLEPADPEFQSQEPADAAADGIRAAAGAIVVPAERNPDAMVEFRLPQNIAISDNLITGSVEYRPLLRPMRNRSGFRFAPSERFATTPRTLGCWNCSPARTSFGTPIGRTRSWPTTASPC